MNVYITTNFTGHWPVGTAAVVIAKDKGHARRQLAPELERRGLEQDMSKIEFEKLDTNEYGAHVLLDGNY